MRSVEALREVDFRKPRQSALLPTPTERVVQGRGGEDYPSRRCALQIVEQQIDQQKMAEMINAHRRLEPFQRAVRDFFGRRKDQTNASITDEDIKAKAQLLKLCNKLTNRGQGGQVQCEEPDIRLFDLALNGCDRGGCLVCIPTRKDSREPFGGHLLSGIEPNARVRSGDDTRLSRLSMLHLVSPSSPA